MTSDDKIFEKASAVLKDKYLCDWCLGRLFGNLISGMTNQERGATIRKYLSIALDAGEKLDILSQNFHGIKFRNAKLSHEKSEKCYLCKNFFDERLYDTAMKAREKLDEIEFHTFLVGTVMPDEIQNAEEKLWEVVGADFVEQMKSEVNRETGKILERMMMGKMFSLKNPDVLVLIDIDKGTMSLQIRSLYIVGGYKKLVRGIPQTRWICPNCGGKGCIECKGQGKLYKTSVQEIIASPAIRQAKGKDSVFHGSGREDIDARCLDYRPFVIEITKPVRRSIDLSRVEKDINKSKKVEVSKLKFSDKEYVRKIKADKYDKMYSAEVEFEKKIDKTKLKDLKSMINAVINQKTPTRVVHRRGDIFRKRKVKSMSWKILNPKKAVFTIKSDAGLYIKELIHGDDGRTKPNVSEILGNKVKKIKLDVIKIWSDERL